jgi:hypothetical protein
MTVASGNGPFVDAPDDEAPLVYQPPPALSCISISGDWRQKAADATVIWKLSQEGNQISGVATEQYLPSCGVLEWNMSGLLLNDGTFALTGTRKSRSTDACGNAGPDLKRVAVHLTPPECNRGSGQSDGRAIVGWSRIGKWSQQLKAVKVLHDRIYLAVEQTRQ